MVVSDDILILQGNGGDKNKYDVLHQNTKNDLARIGNVGILVNSDYLPLLLKREL
ncbi:hypothetical protein BD770DRAFT_471927 [Pilaira anomala]|nr:hypothetical protein BD770DRAFT_471927 [Pilaira anomala]